MPPPKMPDPNDRSPNQPCAVLDKKKALKLYNSKNGTSYKRVTEKVKDGLTEQALAEGWSDVNVTQKHFVFKADVRVNHNVTMPQTAEDSNVVPFRATAKAG